MLTIGPMLYDAYTNNQNFGLIFNTLRMNLFLFIFIFVGWGGGGVAIH